VPLAAALERANGRRGTGTLRRLLADLADEPRFVRSELERRFIALVRRACLPPPVVNGFVAGHEVDFHWSAQRLVVETDGAATHANALAFERDRRRALDLELAGWHVVRISWRQVIDEPHRVTAMLDSRLTP
jgi:very-short-patch-repair endonuclease